MTTIEIFKCKTKEKGNKNIIAKKVEKISFDYLVPLMLPLLIFFLIGFFLIFFVMKTKLFTLQSYYKEDLKVFNHRVRILLFLFSLVFMSIFLGIYNPPYLTFSSTPIEITLIFSVVTGSIVFLIIYKIMIFLMNHNRKFDKNAIKTKYVTFCLLIFIFFSAFSYQSVNIVSASANGFSTYSKPYISPDFSKVAYVAYSNTANNPTPYLVITNLLNGKTMTYKLCIKDSCISFFENFNLDFYNESTVFIKTSVLGNRAFFYNTLTNDLDQLPVNYPTTNFIRFNNSIYSSYLTVDSGLKESYIHLRELNSTDTFTISIPNLQLLSNYNSFLISSDFTKLAVMNDNILNFYKISKFNAILLNSSGILHYNNFHFLPWTNPYVIYYTDYSSSYTYLASYNYSSSLTESILDLPKGIDIINVNVNYSYFIANSPVQIYSLKDANLLKNTSFFRGVWDSSLTNSICWNYKEIVVVNYNPTTNSIYNRKTIDLQLDDTVVQVLNIIEYFNITCTAILVVVIIVISKKEKVWELD